MMKNSAPRSRFLKIRKRLDSSSDSQSDQVESGGHEFVVIYGDGCVLRIREHVSLFFVKFGV